jgi:hypothetical protein
MMEADWTMQLPCFLRDGGYSAGSVAGVWKNKLHPVTVDGQS